MFIGQNCCNGEEACKQIESANMTMIQNSCNMKAACQFASGMCVTVITCDSYGISDFLKALFSPIYPDTIA